MSVMENKAKWIWYPGEFETYLGVDIAAKGFHRSTLLVPPWRIDTPYVSIKFSKEYDIEEDEVIEIEYDGEVAAQIDGAWQLFDRHHKIPLQKGKHTLNITVFNRDAFPSLYIDHPQLSTNESWTVSALDGNPVPAACYDFCDPTVPPSRFKLPETRIDPVTIEKINGGTLYDFGREMMAYVVVNCKGANTVYLGESQAEALDIDCSTLCVPIDADEFKSSQDWALRYAFIPDKEDFVCSEIYALETRLPLKNKGAFKCNDELLNKIYDISLETQHICSREFFLDGIKRDRWVWSGDATISYIINFYSFNDLDICRRTMNLLRGKDPVMINLNTIQDYTCYWFISLYDYYLYTGDTSYLKEIYPKAQSLMEFCYKTVDENGFFRSRKNDWVFIDWADMTKEGILSIMQILFARALQSMSYVAKAIGKEEDSKAYKAAFNKTLNNCFKYFWTEEGYFKHCDSDNSVTRYANMFALLYGFLNPAQEKSVVEKIILNPDVLEITTPYMKFYELLALAKAGDIKAVTNYIRSYWGDMLSLGATTVWEAYVPSQSGEEHLHMYSVKYLKSLCHAWGAGPIALYSQHLLGVTPTAPAFSQFEVKPNLADLREISGKVPTSSGDITVEIKDGSLTVINNSEGVGTVLWQGKEYSVNKHETLTV